VLASIDNLDGRVLITRAIHLPGIEASLPTAPAEPQPMRKLKDQQAASRQPRFAKQNRNAILTLRIWTGIGPGRTDLINCTKSK